LERDEEDILPDAVARDVYAEWTRAPKGVSDGSDGDYLPSAFSRKRAMRDAQAIWFSRRSSECPSLGATMYFDGHAVLTHRLDDLIPLGARHPRVVGAGVDEQRHPDRVHVLEGGERLQQRQVLV